MSVLDPEHLPRVVIESMNQVHEEELELINGLAAELEACLAGEIATEALDAPLAVLVAHMQVHFAGEEERMQAAAFPAFAVHRSDHNATLQEAQAVLDDWLARRDTELLSAYLHDTLGGWLVQHISTMDTVTALYLQGVCSDCEGARESSAASR
jgi:hemerythrin